MGAQGDTARPVATVTERFTGDQADKAAIAELCRRLGFEPDTVTEMRLTARLNGIAVEVTRRAGKPGRRR